MYGPVWEQSLTYDISEALVRKERRGSSTCVAVFLLGPGRCPALAIG
jgi:hypothetical protein